MRPIIYEIIGALSGLVIWRGFLEYAFLETMLGQEGLYTTMVQFGYMLFLSSIPIAVIIEILQWIGTKEKKGFRYCIHCGEKISKDAEYCPECGTRNPRT